MLCATVTKLLFSREKQGSSSGETPGRCLVRGAERAFNAFLPAFIL